MSVTVRDDNVGMDGVGAVLRKKERKKERKRERAADAAALLVVWSTKALMPV
jgi:hypothetical protein